MPFCLILTKNLDPRSPEMSKESLGIRSGEERKHTENSEPVSLSQISANGGYGRAFPDVAAGPLPGGQ